MLEFYGLSGVNSTDILYFDQIRKSKEMMKHVWVIIAVFAGSTLLTFCSTSRSASADKGKGQAAAVSYEQDVAPIMKNRCTPCHFPDGGKVKFLDTYGAVSQNIDHIIYRVQLPQDSARFMPFKGKKPALSDSLVQVLVAWKDSGMAK